MDLNLKQLAKNRSKYKKDLPFLTINENGKSNLSELIQKEKKYRINIDHLANFGKDSKKLVLSFDYKKKEVWECSLCTFLNTNNEDNCVMCNTPQNTFTITNLINSFCAKGYLYGQNNVINKCSEFPIENNLLHGMYFQQDLSFPKLENILELLNNFKDSSSQNNIFIVIYNNNELVSYILHPKLLEWIDKIDKIQDKDKFIKLIREITIFEKNKCKDYNELDLELFCYPTGIK